jgi:predicted aspartyl protease
LNTGTAKSLIGWVDHRRRPLVNLHIWPGRQICAVIDTGFNGYLLWDGPEDVLQFSGASTSAYRLVEVAGGTIMTTVGTTTIQWFQEDDRYIEVETLIATSSKVHRRGDPVVFIGTALLSGLSLFVDFSARTLRIERSD